MDIRIENIRKQALSLINELHNAFDKETDVAISVWTETSHDVGYSRIEKKCKIIIGNEHDKN